MKDLIKLVKVVTKLKQRQFPLLEMKMINENSSKENIFFRYIKKGEVFSDDEAASALYGTDSFDDRYRMLKSRLKQKLLNHLYFLDLLDKQGSNAKFYEQECLQLIHQGRILMLTGEKKIAKGLFIKALTTASRCDFHNFKIDSLNELLKIYSDNCQPHLFESTVEEIEEAKLKHHKELEAEMMYYKYHMLMVKSVNSRKKHFDEMESVLNQLFDLWKKNKSFTNFEYYYKLNVKFKCLQGEYMDLIPFLEEVKSGIYSGESLNPYRLNLLTVKLDQLYVYLRAQRYKEGLNLAERLHDEVFEVYHEYFQLLEYHFLHALKSKEYQTAFEVLTKALDSKRFVTLDTEEQDRWKLYNAYTHFAYAGNFYVRSFNFSKYVEDLPEYDKDNEPYQVAVIILQFFYYLERGDLEALRVRRDLMKKYMSNHFKDNFSYRTRTFYKLLNIVVENELNLKKILGKSKYLITKMEEATIVGDAYQELEIINYDDLWNHLINILQYEKSMD